MNAIHMQGFTSTLRIAVTLLWFCLHPVAYAKKQCPIDPAIAAAIPREAIAFEVSATSNALRRYLDIELEGRMSASKRTAYMRLTGSAPAAATEMLLVDAYRILSNCPSNQGTYWLEVELDVRALRDNRQPREVTEEPAACVQFADLCTHPVVDEELHMDCANCGVRLIVPRQRRHRFTFMLVPLNGQRREWVIANPFTSTGLLSGRIAIAEAGTDWKSFRSTDEAKSCPNRSADEYCQAVLKVMAAKRRYLQLLKTP